MRRAEEALNQLSLGEAGRRRTNVEIYEVGLDQSFG